MLQQINLTYSTEQDRLLLKVRETDGAEYRVWLTRRFMGLLLRVMQDCMGEFGGERQLAASKETVEQVKSGALSSSYEPKASTALPFGEDGVLGYRINYSKDDRNVLTLQLLPREGEGLNLNLGKHTLYMFYTLLEQALPQTAWNLQETAVPPQLLH